MCGKLHELSAVMIAALERLGVSYQEMEAMCDPEYDPQTRRHPDYPCGFPDWDPPTVH